MKISYKGRVRNITQMPDNMQDFRRIAQQKFLNLQLDAPDEDQSQVMKNVLDESDARGDNTEFAKMIDNSISQRGAEEEGKKVRKQKREKNIIDFQNSVCFYEDSEGDFNVISEDEDLQDASSYVVQHNQKKLKCTIVPKKFYEDLRTEQMQSDLNQSVTWQSSMLNQFTIKAKKEKKVKKQKAKNDDKMPASMMNKIEEMVRQRVESELERERSAMSARNDISQSQISHHVDASMSLDSSSVEMTAAYRENLPKMAVLVSDDFMNVEVIEGREIALEFTVQNQSSMAWPFKPFVQNEKDKSIKQHVDAQLQPGQKTVVRYNFRAPLHQDQPKVNILLQLVEPKDYAKFCETTVIVQCNVKSSQPELDNDSMFELGFSMGVDDMNQYNTQPARHTVDAMGEPLDVGDGAAEQKRQALLAMIDQGLDNYRSSAMFDEKSFDQDTRSIVDSLQEGGAGQGQAEQDEALKNAQALLASLKQDDEVDEAEEEAKKQEVRERMAKLGSMIDKAETLRKMEADGDALQ